MGRNHSLSYNVVDGYQEKKIVGENWRKLRELTNQLAEYRMCEKLSFQTNYPRKFLEALCRLPTGRARGSGHLKRKEGSIVVDELVDRGLQYGTTNDNLAIHYLGTLYRDLDSPL